MIALGIDYSINSPATCLVRPGRVDFRCVSTKFELVELESNGIFWRFEAAAPPKFSCDQERFHWHAERSASILDGIDVVDFARIEAYAFAGGGRLATIAEATQTFKSLLWKIRGIDLKTIAPTSLKKEATGNGRSKKPDMADTFQKISGFRASEVLKCKKDEHGPASDCVDAFFAAGGVRNG